MEAGRDSSGPLVQSSSSEDDKDDLEIVLREGQSLRRGE